MTEMNEVEMDKNLWLAQARSDYISAWILFLAFQRRNALFLMHMSLERTIKGILIAQGIHLNNYKTHKLNSLYSNVAQKGLNRAEYNLLNKLSRYFSEYRYPSKEATLEELKRESYTRDLFKSMIRLRKKILIVHRKDVRS